MTELLKPLYFLQHGHGKNSFYFMADAYYHNPIMDLIALETGISRDEFNGYEWAELIAQLIAEEFADKADQIQLDPEAGMFSAISENDALLLRLGLRFQALLQDETRLIELLKKTDF